MSRGASIPCILVLLTPVFELITILSIKSFFTRGYEDKIAPVGKHPGLVTKLAFSISFL